MEQEEKLQMLGHLEELKDFYSTEDALPEQHGLSPMQKELYEYSLLNNKIKVENINKAIEVLRDK